jgi:quercetin dioxygenase-like cupin family protein
MKQRLDTELAEDYVLGALSLEERENLSKRLETNGALAAAVGEWESRLSPLALAGSVAPPPDMLDRIEARIAAAGSELPGTFTSRGEGAPWVEMIPGLKMRLLYRNEAARRQTILVRMEPNATFPEHGHDDQDEEIYILEGDLVIGELTLNAGDYHLARADRVHPQHWSRTGCVALINQGY